MPKIFCLNSVFFLQKKKIIFRMLRSSGIKTITRNIRTKDEKYLQPKPTLQRRPGDWYGGPTGDRNWNHLINTKKDIHSLIKLERLGMLKIF